METKKIVPGSQQAMGNGRAGKSRTTITLIYVARAPVTLTVFTESPWRQP